VSFVEPVIHAISACSDVAASSIQYRLFGASASVPSASMATTVGLAAVLCSN
jgi:hypothetical protein